MRAELLIDCRNELGEGCIWDPRDDCLYWVDIEGKRAFRMDQSNTVETFELPERAGFILPRQQPGFVIGFASRIAVADPSLGEFQTIVEIEPHLPQTRVNDAAVDPFGGIVFGTFDERDRQPVASVYRLGPEGRLHRLFDSVTISNGLAFSPDGSIMYFADTIGGTIRRFLINGEFSLLQEVAPLAGPDVAPGAPDGAIVDSEGFYWNARVWGGCLVRISPDGDAVSIVQIPTKGPTCIALGGPELKRLFATTLRRRHTLDELARQPAAGGLFAVDVEVAGQPQRLCLL